MMKCKNFFVTAKQDQNYSYVRDAAEHINVEAMGAIGTTAFNADDEYSIIKFLENEIESCIPEIRDALEIQFYYEELEDDDE